MRMVGPVVALEMGRNAFTVLTEYASYPLTVLWGLQEAAKAAKGIAQLKDRKSLVVHIVGAELPFECKLQHLTPFKRSFSLTGITSVSVRIHH